MASCAGVTDRKVAAPLSYKAVACAGLRNNGPSTTAAVHSAAQSASQNTVSVGTADGAWWSKADPANRRQNTTFNKKAVGGSKDSYKGSRQSTDNTALAAFLQSGSFLVTGDSEGNIRFWNDEGNWWAVYFSKS
jgi:hypothetical protein